MVWLVGMPGSGKSTVGALLADRLGLRFVDADREIEERTGTDVTEIFSASGEESFRALEREVLADLARGDGAVVACGGGAVVDPANRDVLRDSGTVVYLQVPPDVLARRLRGSHPRPVVEDAEGVDRLSRRRAADYEGASHVAVPASGSPDSVAAAIAERLG